MYKKVSGQTINFEKSSFVVSKNTKPQMSNWIGSFLGVKACDSLGDYLGMCSHVGRNEHKMFQRIRERV